MIHDNMRATSQIALIALGSLRIAISLLPAGGKAYETEVVV